MSEGFRSVPYRKAAGSGPQMGATAHKFSHGPQLTMAQTQIRGETVPQFKYLENKLELEATCGSQDQVEADKRKKVHIA